MTDSAALCTLIKEKGLKYKYIAQKLGITPYGLKLKIDNRSEFKASEISCLCEILNIINLSEREQIFFRKE